MSRKLFLSLSLLLTFVFSVAGLGVLINAFVKSHNELSHLQKVVPSGTVLNINDKNILNTGRVSTAIHALLIVLSLASLSVLSITRFSSPKAFFALALALGFSSVWLLATTIAFTALFATKAAKVSATLHGIAIPQVVINAEAKALGLSPVYKNVWYLRVATIIPWFTFLFAVVSSGLMLHDRSASKEVDKALIQKDAEDHHDSVKDEKSPT